MGSWFQFISDLQEYFIVWNPEEQGRYIRCRHIILFIMSLSLINFIELAIEVEKVVRFTYSPTLTMFQNELFNNLVASST